MLTFEDLRAMVWPWPDRLDPGWARANTKEVSAPLASEKMIAA